MIEEVAIPEERIKILRNARKWENKLKNLVDVKIEILDYCVRIESEDPIKLLRVKEVIMAFGRGFNFNDALDLLDDEYCLEVLDVKGFTGKSKNRAIELKGRVIGRKGKAKNLIEKYTETKIVIYGKTVSIIGMWKNVNTAKKAVEMLLCGCKHTTVYRFLKENMIV